MPPPPSSWAPGWVPRAPLPGSGRFRAQAVGELLDSAFTLYRRNFRLLVAITAVVQVPLALFSYLAYQLTGYTAAASRLAQFNSQGPLTQQQLQQELADLRSPLITLLVTSFVLLVVQTLLLQPVATAAMTRAVGDVYLDKPTSVRAVYAAVGRRIGPVVGVAALLLLAGIGLAVVVVGLTLLAVLGLGQSGALLLIVIVPGAVFAMVVVYTRWLFAAPIVILEPLGPTAALRRSWALVRRSTGRVFGITILVGLITGILSAAVGAVLSVATQAGDENLRLILTQLASLLISVLIQPISFIVVVLLYYDTRIRREAFDIEMLAATL